MVETTGEIKTAKAFIVWAWWCWVSSKKSFVTLLLSFSADQLLGVEKRS